MAYLSSRPISARCAMGVLAAALVAALPAAQSAAQSAAASSADSPADRAAAVPAGAPEANSPPGAEGAKSGESAPATAGESPQERDRRLVLLRLLVMGGGNYRPFGFFR
jgi:hypothetical protein